ncbi:MAG: MoaD/ThiS family protein [Chloroflexota bacterium]
MRVRVRVRAFGGLARFMPQGVEQTELDLPDGATIAELRERVGIPEQHIWLVSVGGRQATADQVLRDGDLVTFMAPVDGG